MVTVLVMTLGGTQEAGVGARGSGDGKSEVYYVGEII